MHKNKEMYSKAYMQLQLDEMAKKAGKVAKDNINKMLAHTSQELKSR